MTLQIPARGTRPRNRKELILAAARTLFHEQGYSATSIGDIADTVAVGPSALYRHFPGKQQLLEEVLRGCIETTRAAAQAASTAADPMRALVRAALEQREFGVLWERESRHLDPPTRAALSVHLQGVVEAVADIVRVLRPDADVHDTGTSSTGTSDTVYLARLVVAVLVSPSFQRPRLSAAEEAQLLTELATAAARLDLAALSPATAAATTSEPPRSRREELLAAAITHFARHGYQESGIEDIAARVGLTGNSIYRHFPTKADLLYVAMIRGAEWLRLDLTRAYADSNDPQEILGALVHSYVTLTMAHPDLMGVLLTEVRHLPEPQREHVRQEQLDHAGAWLTLLRRLRPDEDERAARFRAMTVFVVANLCARNPHLRARPTAGAAVEALARAILGLGAPPSPTPTPTPPPSTTVE